MPPPILYEIVGFVLSSFIVKLLVVVLPASSVATYCTVEVPWALILRVVPFTKPSVLVEAPVTLYETVQSPVLSLQLPLNTT